jgi:hypothetical protein
VNAPHRQTVRRFAVVVLVVLLVNAGPPPGALAQEGPELDAAANNTTRLFLPYVARDAGLLPPIIPPTTNPLPPETTEELLSVSSDGVTYTFDTMTAALAAVAPGEIIVAAPSAAAPDGFLRRVAAINQTGGDVIVQTEGATLEDAIQQGEVNYSEHLSASGMQPVALAPGVTLMPTSSLSPAATFYVQINEVVIYDDDGNPATTNDQIRANGSVEFDPIVNFHLVVQDWTIEHLSFRVDAHETANLEFETRVEKTILR